MAKYATSEKQLSCSCGVRFAPREGHPIRLQTHNDEWEEGVCCPRCQTSWWMASELGLTPESDIVATEPRRGWIEYIG